MKTYINFLILIIIIVLFGCNRNFTTKSSPERIHPLIGTWVLVSSNNTNPEGEYFILDKSNARQIKIVNPTHWMFIQERIKEGEREFVSAAGGRYIIEDNNYTEIIDYASWEDYPDIKTDFTWKIEDDKWIHTGVLHLPEGEKYLIEEVWERVDEKTSLAKRE